MNTALIVAGVLLAAAPFVLIGIGLYQLGRFIVRGMRGGGK